MAPEAHGRSADLHVGALLLVLAWVSAGCGSPGSNPDGGAGTKPDGGTSTLPDGGTIGGSDGGPTLAGDDTSSLPWDFVATLKGPMTGSGLYGYYANSLFFVPGARYALSDGGAQAVTLQGDPGGTFGTGVLCQVGPRAYLLGGGGSGVYDAWADYHYEVANLDTLAWEAGGPHAFPLHSPGLAAGEGQCFLLGGYDGFSNSTAVQTFQPGTGTWGGTTPLPVALQVPGGAVVGGKVIALGGARAYQAGDPNAITNWGTAVAATHVLDPSAESPAWAPGPALPAALASPTVLEVAGRLYVLGGYPNGSYVVVQRQVYSWAVGEAAWRTDGDLPHRVGNLLAAVTDGTSVYLVLTAQWSSGSGFDTRLYRWTP